MNIQKISGYVALGALTFGITWGALSYSRSKPQELLYMDLDGRKNGSEIADDIAVNYGNGNIDIKLRNSENSYDKIEDLRQRELTDAEKTKDKAVSESLEALTKARTDIRADFRNLERELDKVK